MEDARSVLTFIYRNARTDKAAAIRAVHRQIELFRHERLPDVIRLLSEVTASEPRHLRSSNLEPLGDVLAQFTYGPIATLRQLAIEAYEIALSADVSNASLRLKLAAAWYERIGGDRDDNLARAIRHLEHWLTQAPSRADGHGAVTLNLLGLAWSGRAPSRWPQRSREAARCFIEALGIFRHLHESAYEASVHLNFGNLLASDADYDPAIEHYRDALQRYSALGSRDDIALVERNLGVTLLDRSNSRRPEDIEEAIRLLESALAKIVERPNSHAVGVTLNNIGRAHALRIEGAQGANFIRARDAFKRAAAIFTELRETSNARIATASAGGIDYEMNQWADAGHQFERAIELLELEWRDTLTPQTRVQLDRDGSRIFDFGVLAVMKLGDRDHALHLLERGRHRLFVETYYSKWMHAVRSTSSELWQQAEKVRQRRSALEHELTQSELRQPSGQPLPTFERFRRDIEDLRRQEELAIERIKKANPDFVPVASPLEPDRIAALAQRLNAYICAARPTSKGTMLFVFAPDRTMRDTILEDATVEYWNELLFRSPGWVPKYREFRRNRPFAGNRWRTAMDATLREIYQVVVSPSLSLMSLPLLEDTRPREPEFPRIYFLAGGVLDLLPLHAAFCESGGERRYLADVANVAYFSSFRLLEQAVERSSRMPRPGKVFAFSGEDDRLPFVAWEAAFAARLFGTDAVCRTLASTGRSGSARALAISDHEPSMLLLSCHAVARPNDGLRSGLYFSTSHQDEPDLTIADLLGLELSNCGLVLLSACETSLKEVDDCADECLSLSNVFLAAGATAAIGTQWAANDISAALWTARFLCASREHSHDVLEWACSTSRWIRQSSLHEKKALLESCRNRLPDQFERLLDKDFTHPFFWANHKFCGAALPASRAEARST